MILFNEYVNDIDLWYYYIIKELKCFTEISKNLKVFTYFKYIDKAILLNIVINQLLSYNIVTYRVQNQMCYQLSANKEVLKNLKAFWIEYIWFILIII